MCVTIVNIRYVVAVLKVIPSHISLIRSISQLQLISKVAKSWYCPLYKSDICHFDCEPYRRKWRSIACWATLHSRCVNCSAAFTFLQSKAADPRIASYCVVESS